MPAKRGGGVPLLGKEETVVRHPERFVPATARPIGSLNKNIIEEAGATRVKRKNSSLKREMKAWRVNSPFRRWRVQNNLTIQEAADSLGVANMTYQQWEYGRYGIPRFVNVHKQRVNFNENVAPICGFTRAIHNSWIQSKPKPELKAQTIKGKKK